MIAELERLPCFDQSFFHGKPKYLIQLSLHPSSHNPHQSVEPTHPKQLLIFQNQQLIIQFSLFDELLVHQVDQHQLKLLSSLIALQSLFVHQAFHKGPQKLKLQTVQGVQDTFLSYPNHVQLSNVFSHQLRRTVY